MLQETNQNHHKGSFSYKLLFIRQVIKLVGLSWPPDQDKEELVVSISSYPIPLAEESVVA